MSEQLPVSEEWKWIDLFFEVGAQYVTRAKKRKSRVPVFLQIVEPAPFKDLSWMGLTETTTHRKYWITICAHRMYPSPTKGKPDRWNVTPYSKTEILDVLAHELAHVVEFNHTPKHIKHQAEISKIFSKLLEESGYKDSESENIRNKYIYENSKRKGKRQAGSTAAA